MVISRSAVPILLLAAAAGLTGAAVTFSNASPPESSVSNRPTRGAEDGYITSASCKACHPAEYNSWYASYHRTMTQVATPSTARPSFENVVVDGVHGRPMRLEERGRQLWAEFDDPDGAPDASGMRPRVSREVLMITGSHHQQVFWYGSGHQTVVGQLPGVYLIREDRWIPRRTAVLHPPSDPWFSETGHWNSTCIACHATHGKPQFDTPFGSADLATQSVKTTAVEFGIACEACHGPGDTHARSNRNPLRRYGLRLRSDTDATIVQPARLAPRVSSQVCGQCHGVWEFYDSAGERQANSGGLPFRPGAELTSTRFLAQPTVNGDSSTMKTLLADDAGFVRDSFWADGMVRVSGREYNGLIESPCFKQATDASRTLTCFSCHTMHKTADDRRPQAEWAVDQLSTGKNGDDACLTCHQSYRTTLTSHTKHAPDSSGSRCYNCHMPYTTYGLLKTIRSHTVSSPSVRESLDTGRPNACNLCHLDKTLEWTQNALARSFDAQPTTLGDDEKKVAASLLWLLKGDAAKRAIVAEAMAWEPAKRASGTDWMAPHLATLLDDPYDAVRFIAGRSLRSLPQFDKFSYDFVSSPKERYQAQLRTMALWDRSRERRRTDTHLLFDAEGNVAVNRVLRLMKERDNRRIRMRE